MDTYAAIDLASKFSAWNFSRADGELRYQGHSSGTMSALGLANHLAEAVSIMKPRIVLIEDVPYGISRQSMVKPVLRLQGMILHSLYSGALPDDSEVFFINPQSWQKTFDGVAFGPAKDRIEAARIHAKRLGYEPPNLVQDFIDNLPEGARVLKKHTDPLAKSMTDYIDARLMIEFIRNHNGKIAGLSGVQPPVI